MQSSFGYSSALVSIPDGQHIPVWISKILNDPLKMILLSQKKVLDSVLSNTWKKENGVIIFNPHKVWDNRTNTIP